MFQRSFRQNLSINSHYPLSGDSRRSPLLKGKMSARRMISDTVTGMDAFVEMPLSAQALYFHLVLQADNKGFLASAVKTMRMIGATADDLECLIQKGFILRFPGSPVICITHWCMMNSLKDKMAKSEFPEARLVRLNGGVYVPYRNEEEEE